MRFEKNFYARILKLVLETIFWGNMMAGKVPVASYPFQQSNYNYSDGSV